MFLKIGKIFFYKLLQKNRMKYIEKLLLKLLQFLKICKRFYTVFSYFKRFFKKKKQTFFFVNYWKKTV